MATVEEQINSIDSEIESLDAQLRLLRQYKADLVPSDIKRFEAEVTEMKLQRQIMKLRAERAELLIPENFEFANRYKEQEELTVENYYRYYQVYAPEGYGKSKLLKKISSNLFKNGWCNCYIDFKREENIEARYTISETIRALLGSLNIEASGDIIHRLDVFSEKLALIQPQNPRAKIALFFDDIQFADFKVLLWICTELIEDLKQRQKDVYVYFASSYKVELPLNSTKYKAFALSRFQGKDIDEAVRSRFRQQGISDDVREKVIQNILELCLGHPACVFGILDAISSVPKFDKDGSKLEKYDELFESIVKPVIYTDVLKNAEPNISLESLKLLFIPRLIGVGDLLKFFPDEEKFHELNLSEPGNLQEFVQQKLPATGLFAPPSRSSRGFSGDPAVRHTIILDMINGHPQFKVINERAFEIYMNRAQKEIGFEQVPPFIEALYHFNNILLLDSDKPKNREKIRDFIQNWRTKINADGERIQDILAEYNQLLQNDPNIGLLLDRAAGISTFSEVLRLINQPLSPVS